MKKPTPKTQKQISNEMVNTYNPEGSHTGVLTDPNLNITSPKDRQNQISYKDDTVKPMSISIKDIDEAIMYYFQNVIKASVVQNGQRIPIPIMYGAPERWYAAQKNGFLRDASGRLMAPLIMFKRDSIEKDRSLSNKLDANTPFNYQIVAKKYSNRNAYDRFDILQNRKPQLEYHVVVVPDYVKLKYSCVIYTYFMEQMNPIIETINYASDAYWGDPQRFKFKSMIDSFATTTELVDGKDRTIKTSFDIKLNGYLIPNDVLNSVNSVCKQYGISTITIDEQISTL